MSGEFTQWGAEIAQITARLATTPDEVHAAMRLRYDVFVRELGGNGPLVDHRQGLERDRFDGFAEHLIAIAPDNGEVVGTYRLMDREGARRAGGFYCDDEYDLTPIITSGRQVLELGRSCIRADHRGGTAMTALWQALARHVLDRRIEILFGVASFHGTNVVALSEPLSILHHRHLAPPHLRVRARRAQRMDLVSERALDRRRAMLDLPALIKAYLRLGGVVGEGAFIDHDFNTTDICMILDVARLSDRQRALYTGSLP